MAGLIFFTLISAFAISFFGTFFFRKLSFKFDIVDTPGKRKVHKEPMPLLGGAAIYCGFIFAYGLTGAHLAGSATVVLAGSAIFFINLIDDIRDLSSKTRFAVEILVSLVVIFSGAKIDFLPPGIIGTTTEVFITIIWIVGITNAFNYLDGLNGLATGSAIINLAFFALILHITGQETIALLALILAAACLGFLPHNFKKARIFLGDNGSTFLGFMLATIPLAANWAQNDLVRISIPIIILGVPIFDMTFTTIMRVRDGKVKTFSQWLKYAGKDHFHHSLVYVGLSPFRAVIFIWATTFSLGLSALLIANTIAWKSIVTLLQTSIIFLMIGVLIVVGRHHKSGWKEAE